MARVRCSECGAEAPEGYERCPRCGAPVPVLFGGADEVGMGPDDGATVVTVGVPRGGAESGDVIADRYQASGDPRPDLWGAWVRVRDLRENRDVTLYRVERSVFRTRDDIERFRTSQQDLMEVDEPALATPERLFEAGGLWYLVYGQRFAGSLRESGAAAAFRGANPDHVKRVLHFVADYLSALSRLGTRGLHLALRPGAVLVLGRELRVAQTGFCSALPEDLVARRIAHDNEAKFFAAPEVVRQGRGSARADVYSLGLLVGYSISSRERSPQLKGFQPHPRFARIFSTMVAPNEIQRPADAATLSSAVSALAALDEVITAPRSGPAPPDGTQDVAIDDIEPLDDQRLGRDATGEIDVGEIVPVREADGTGEIDVGEIEAVTGETPALFPGRTGELGESGFESFDDTGASAPKVDLPVVGDDSWQPAASRARPVPSTAPRAAAPRDSRPTPVRAEESDGAIDPRLLRAAVRSDSSKGIAAKGKAVDLLRRDAAKGDARAKELLMDASARLPARPVAAPAPGASALAGVPAPGTSVPPVAAAPKRTLIGAPAAAFAPVPRSSAPAYDPFAPAVRRPSAPPPAVVLPEPSDRSATVRDVPQPPAAFAPPPLALRPSSFPPPAPVAPPPRASWPPTVPSPGPQFSRPPPVTAPSPAPPLAAPPRPSWPPTAPPSPGLQLSRPPAAPSRPAPAPAPPVRIEIPSSVVGPDLVVKPTPTPLRAPVPDEPEVATTQATPAATPVAPPAASSTGAMPVVVRKVPRPTEEERDLPSTVAWTPKREPEGPPSARPAAGSPAPLFDDSYKLFRADELEKGPPPLPAAQAPAPDRSMDLIWWSLAIAGLLVLVALLITFR